MADLDARNLLARETSPYLRQHADNPVHWRPWSGAALQEAVALDRPILLSVGYSACHWCHVMAHESFEDPDVAAVMNRLFVNIKVDREERPDIDQIYMAALTAMGEQGGWPLTMFLTADARPFWGGTYFPRNARYGRPGFIEVLEAVARTWTQKRDDLARSGGALYGHVQARLSPDVPATNLSGAPLRQLAEAVGSSMDVQLGGLRGAPKFPNAPFMRVLWLDWKQNGTESGRDAVVTSLRKMLAGGIYDHVGGGLCRYSTDAEWMVPHFEKMLYDNAQLIDIATSAYAETGDELFRVRIEETIVWLQREMLLPGGGLASSLDADSEGEEGRFYLWTTKQIVEALGEDEAARFLDVYELAAPPGWDGAPILHRRGAEAYGPADTDPRIIQSRNLLRETRARRVPPGRDDKVLVDWNGLAIAAIAKAGRAFGRNEWIRLAEDLFRFITESTVGGRLPHSINGEHRLFPGIASDYAAMIIAAVRLAEATQDPGYGVQALAWLDQLDRWYGDGSASGHFLTASDSPDVPMRVRGDVDEAIPSATSQITEAMVSLALLTSNDTLQARAYATAERALGRAGTLSYGQAGIVHAAELARLPRKLVIVDASDGELVAAANRLPDPRRTDIVLRPSAERTSVTLSGGATLDTNRSGAWLCVGQSCMPAVRDSEALVELLTAST